MLNVDNMTLNELTQIAMQDFEKRRLAAEVRAELLDLRLSGLSTLQLYKEPLIEATEEDIEWYKADLSTPMAFENRIMKRLIREAPYSHGNLDTTEADEYMRDCAQQERGALGDYIKENYDFLTRQYTFYISEWFTAWYAFWSDQVDTKKAQLDWDIYFSLLADKPPKGFLVRFNEVILKLNTIQRSEIRPKYLRWCWKNEEIRKKVLRGEMFEHNNMICPYSTVFDYVHRRQEELSNNAAIRNILKQVDGGKLTVEDGKVVIVKE